MPAGNYTLIESFALEYQWQSKHLEEGVAIENPLSIQSYYANSPKVVERRSPRPSVALFRSGPHNLLLCQIAEVCSPALTWLSLETVGDSSQTARVVKRKESLCVTSKNLIGKAPHNKSLERTRAR
jgi:hypothetical protein